MGYRFVLDANRVQGVVLTYRDEMDQVRESPLLKRVETEATPRLAPAVRAAFDACVGEYTLAPGRSLTFWREGDRLWAELTGMGRSELLPENETTYLLKATQGKVAFAKGAAGKVERVVLDLGGRQMPATRIQ